MRIAAVFCVVIVLVLISVSPIQRSDYRIHLNNGNHKVLVIKNKFILLLFRRNKPVFVCRVAIGKDEFENKTPEGVFKFIDKERDYPWYPTKDQKRFYAKKGIVLSRVVESKEPYNPWGDRRLKLGITRVDGFNIFVHNTNDISAIGKAVTTGCVRVSKKSMNVIYPEIKIGDSIEIVRSL